MKIFRLIIVVFGLLSTVCCAKAQHWTIWYGANVSQYAIIKDVVSNHQWEWRFANAGVDYRFLAGRWDFALGAGLNTKGSGHRVHFVQIETNAGYRFVETQGRFSASAFTGPYLGLKLFDDKDTGVTYNPVSIGWQGGLLIRYRPVSLKVGYERSFNTLVRSLSGSVFPDMSGTSRPAQSVTMIPHAIFVRLGFEF